jgi:hypothetical protein
MGCYNIYFTTQVSLHDEWGPRLEISVVEGYPAVFLPPWWFLERSPPCFASLSHYAFPHGADLNGLTYRPHQPTNCGWRAWVQSLLTDVVPSRHTVWVNAALDHLSMWCKAPRQTISHDIDHPGLRWTRSCMEKPAFTRADLSDVRVIMLIMRAPVVELLCQAGIGWIPVLKWLLLGARGCLWSCPVVLGIKCHCFPTTQL